MQTIKTSAHLTTNMTVLAKTIKAKLIHYVNYCEVVKSILHKVGCEKLYFDDEVGVSDERLFSEAMSFARVVTRGLN